MNRDSWFARLGSVENPGSTYRAATANIVLERAAGSLVWDTSGQRYIDLCAGFGALVLGHAPACHAATVDCHFRGSNPLLSHGLGDVYASRAKIELLESLRAHLPPRFGQGLLAVTGGQAVEAALKTAMLFTRSHGVIAFDGGYHGLDLGLLPLVSREDFRRPFTPWCPEDRVVRLPWGCATRQLDAALAQLRSHGVSLAAVLAEPIQGRAGVRLPPDGWLTNLANWAHAQHALFVLDDVFAGMGRSGRWSSSEDVDCDILCLGKGLGGGFPVSATFGTRPVMEAWPKCTGEAIHTGTFFGHPLSCSVACATLDALDRERLVERSLQWGKAVIATLTQRLSCYPCVKEVRGRGLMIAFELTQAGMGATLMDKLRERGVIAIPSGEQGQCLSITPALNIPEDLLLQAFDVIERSVADL